jgi:hypothetical protein
LSERRKQQDAMADQVQAFRGQCRASLGCSLVDGAIARKRIL